MKNQKMKLVQNLAMRTHRPAGCAYAHLAKPTTEAYLIALCVGTDKAMRTHSTNLEPNPGKHAKSDFKF